MWASPALAQMPSTELVLAQATSSSSALISSDRARLQRLFRDIASARAMLEDTDNSVFQDSAQVQRWHERIERFQNTLQRYVGIDDPDVNAAVAALLELREQVDLSIQTAEQQSHGLGDVQQRLATLEAALHHYPAPPMLPAPFDEAEARRWVNYAGYAKRNALNAITELEIIRDNAYLPHTRGTVAQGAPYDSQDVQRLLNFAQRIVSGVDTAVDETTSQLRHQINFQDRELNYYRNLDPDDPQHRSNAFLVDGAQERIYAGLAQQMALVESFAAYQRAFGVEPNTVTVARIDEINQLRTRYAAQRESVLGDSRLPESRSQDAALMSIAAAILAEPHYSFGPHGPIILTSEGVSEHEQQVSRAEIRDMQLNLAGDLILTGIETTWNYRWQEFKFATPIQSRESGDWHIWWITARNFSSGWEGTPIGRWVSGRAVQGDLILPENF